VRATIPDIVPPRARARKINRRAKQKAKKNPLGLS